jgi:RNA polymerase sigma factor (sigma-70 family)
VKADCVRGSVEQEDFAAFFTRTSPGLLARAMMFCRHRQDAEDAVQNTYITAFRSWDRIREEYESPEAWLYTVLRNELCAQARKKARERKVIDVMPVPHDATPEQTAEAMAVLEALAGLPTKQRTALVLHGLFGMPQEEIAAKLGIRRVTVAGNVRNARRTLERVLELEPRRRRGSADDSLVPNGRFPVPIAVPGARMSASVDTLTAMLRATERWLREGVEDSPEAVERVRAGIESALGQPLIRERRNDRAEGGEDAASGVDKGTGTDAGEGFGAEADR